MGGRIDTRRGSNRYFLNDETVQGIFGESMFIKNIREPFVIKGHDRIPQAGSRVAFDFVIAKTSQGMRPVVKNFRTFAAARKES